MHGRSQRASQQIDYIFPCVCTVIDHRGRHSVNIKNKKCDTRLLFFTRCDVFGDLLQYTRTEKCNLFILNNKNLIGLLKDLWGM